MEQNVYKMNKQIHIHATHIATFAAKICGFCFSFWRLIFFFFNWAVLLLTAAAKLQPSWTCNFGCQDPRFFIPPHPTDMVRTSQSARNLLKQIEPIMLQFRHCPCRNILHPAKLVSERLLASRAKREAMMTKPTGRGCTSGQTSREIHKSEQVAAWRQQPHPRGLHHLAGQLHCCPTGAALHGLLTRAKLLQALPIKIKGGPTKGEGPCLAKNIFLATHGPTHIYVPVHSGKMFIHSRWRELYKQKITNLRRGVTPTHTILWPTWWRRQWFNEHFCTLW